MFLVAVSVILVLCFCIYVNNKNDRTLIAKIPGPTAWPLVGNSLNYVLPPEKLFLYMRFLYKKYKGINQVYAVNLQAVNIYDPDDVEKILSNTRFNTKENPYTFLKPWLNEGLLISNGRKWQQRRKLLTRAFHFNILKKYTQSFIKRTDLLVEQIARDVCNSTDVLSLITETTLDIMCESEKLSASNAPRVLVSLRLQEVIVQHWKFSYFSTMISEQSELTITILRVTAGLLITVDIVSIDTTMGTLDEKGFRETFNDYFKALHTFGQIIANRVCKFWLYFDFIFMISHLYFIQKRSVKTLHDLTMSIIKHRKQKYYDNKLMSPEENDVYEAKGNLAMLDLLLQNEKEGFIDLNGVREEVDTFMFEGHDTTAMAITFFLMRIANEPEAQNKIFKELQSIFGDSSRSPTTEDLNDMKYLECCIKESLRLYPSVPFISRILTEEVTLGGYKVGPGTLCQIHIFDIHRCNKLYPHPEEFIPERFLPENTSQRHLYAYIPFSAGSRNCIGQKFAMLEMKTLLSGVLRNYRIEPVTRPQDLVFKADIVLRTNHPIYVKFCNRNCETAKKKDIIK